MKTYGLKRKEVWADDWATGKVNASRKGAQRKRKDKKSLHRRERRCSQSTTLIQLG
jgi:hypothetical protein